MLYVDDGIFAGPDKTETENLIIGLQKEFNITDEGDLTEYLRVLVEKQKDGHTKLSQPHLIKQILDHISGSMIEPSQSQCQHQVDRYFKVRAMQSP
jgi:hypothetical protein